MNRFTKRTACFLVMLTSIAQPAFGQPLPTSKPVRLVTVSQPDNPGLVKLRVLLDKAFSSAGLVYTLDFKPPERALQEFKRGAYDGDPDRSEIFSEFFSRAIRIDPHIATTYYFAISKQPLNQISSWRQLDKYSVAYPFGFKTIEVHLRDITRKFTPSTEASCVEMVVAERVDVCVLPSDVPQAWDQQKEFEGKVFAQQFTSVNTHLWLAPNQVDVALRLSNAMRKLEAKGELQQLMGAQRASK